MKCLTSYIFTRGPVQYSIGLYSAIQYSAVQDSAVQDSVWCPRVRSWFVSRLTFQHRGPLAAGSGPPPPLSTWHQAPLGASLTLTRAQQHAEPGHVASPGLLRHVRHAADSSMGAALSSVPLCSRARGGAEVEVEGADTNNNLDTEVDNNLAVVTAEPATAAAG